MSDRKGLNLDAFQPRAPKPESAEKPARRAKREREGQGAGWVSREPETRPLKARQRKDQLNMFVEPEDAERFRAICKADRRTYGDMLVIMMDAWEGQGG